MSGNCDICHKVISSKGRSPGVKCGLCTSRFHVKCANISDAAFEELKTGATSWQCPDCRSNTNNSIIDDENDVENIVPLNNLNNNTSLTDLVIILQGMQNQLVEVKNSLNFLCQTFEDMKTTINQLTIDSQCFTDKIGKLERKCEEQDDKISIIEAHLDRPAQEANKSNIVFCGIPTNIPEGSIHELIIQVIGLIGVQVTNEDIVSIKKMVHYTETASLLKNASIVKLKSVELTNNILTLFRKRKVVALNELGANYTQFPPHQRIILLHHFTRLQSQLYNAAKIIKNNYKYQFLWCKYNNIYLRKTTDSKVYSISSFNDIKRLRKTMHRLEQMATESTSSRYEPSASGSKNSQ